MTRAHNSNEITPKAVPVWPVRPPGEKREEQGAAGPMMAKRDTGMDGRLEVKQNIMKLEAHSIPLHE